jgi:hypothetical protein
MRYISDFTPNTLVQLTQLTLTLHNPTLITECGYLIGLLEAWRTEGHYALQPEFDKRNMSTYGDMYYQSYSQLKADMKMTTTKTETSLLVVNLR